MRSQLIKWGRFYLSPYQLVNISLAFFILLIFIYSAIFSAEGIKHPIPSSQSVLGGEYTASTGLSRSFSCIIRFQFDQARQFNAYGIQLFFFFLLQFGLRVFYTITDRKLRQTVGIESVVLIDSITSGILLILFFEPFWKEIF